LPKSSTRRKSRLLFVIETARAFTLVGETGYPAPREPLFSFSKKANTKIKMAFSASLKELSAVSREVAGAKGRV
jgi:hypothetical protein